MNSKHLTRIIAVALCAAVVFSLCSCRPTDFFTEVVISPFAETVDEDNDQVTVINSPDADTESDMLSALDWTDDSHQSEDVENLVVYSSDPTTELNTRNSIFDLYPKLEGAESSLGVRLLYASDAETDAEVSAWLEQQEQTDAESESVSDVETEQQTDGRSTQDSDADDESESGDGGTADDSATDAGSGGDGDDSGSGDDGTGGGDGSGGSGDSSGVDTGDGSGDTDVSGTSEQPWSGLDGDVKEYDAGNALMSVNEVDGVGVIGTNAAVTVQAIGGAGSIYAMSYDAFYGTDDDASVMSFADVFCETDGLDADYYEQNVLLWENDGSDPDDLTDAEALAEACGQDGVIVYDQSLGDQTTLFSKEQRQVLEYYGIMLVPVDFTSVQGMLDAVAVIGDALANSETCEQDAEEQADAYWDAVDSIVEGVADMHGGTLAKGSSTHTALLTEYSSCPVSSVTLVGGYNFPVVCYIVTQVDTGWTWDSSSTSFDVSDVLLFRKKYVDGSTNAFWLQAAGVSPNTTVTSDAEGATADTIEVLWPYYKTSQKSLVGTGSTYSEWIANGSNGVNMSTGPRSTGEGMADASAFGLGSKLQPYVVVSATSEYSAGDVRELVLDSMDSYTDSETISSYSVLAYEGTGAEGEKIPGTGKNELYRSTIGATNYTYTESPFFTGLSTSSVVREAPTGLLGTWTADTFESVLLSIWLGELYSYSPSGCDYEPFNDVDEFSCTIGDEECTSLEQAVEAFYGLFYRMSSADIEDCYDDVVTDQFEDLQDE